MSIRTQLKKISIIRAIYFLCRTIKTKDIFCKRAKVVNNGYGSYNKMIIGKKNSIIIGNNTRLKSTLFHIVGENNIVEIGENCRIGPHCSFWVEGSNIRIKVGSNTRFTQYVHINAQENGSSIEIGEDCGFSNHITVRTSDSHAIIDLKTGRRINPALPVRIGNHVWICPDTKIMKGAIIGDGSIIGSNSIVTKEIPSCCMAAGMPAKVIKEGVTRTNDDIVFGMYNYGKKK